MQPYSIVAVSGIEPGDHLCILYETEQQHQELLTSFIRSGLEQGQKVVYIVDSHTADVILEYLAKVGVETAGYMDSGQLSILNVEGSYLREGSFDPDAMIDLLRREERLALEEGYSALRVTGEMTWVLRGQPGSERLIEYEAKLNTYFPGSRALALCQYDRWAFDARLLLDVIATHPIVVIGTEAYDNFYYTTPGQLQGGDDATFTLNQRIGQLKARKRLEESLRDSEKLYRTIFNGSNDAIYLYYLDEESEPAEFLEVNDGACRLLDYSREKLMKMNRLDLVAPDQPGRLPGVHPAAAVGGAGSIPDGAVDQEGRPRPGGGERPPDRPGRAGGGALHRPRRHRASSGGSGLAPFRGEVLSGLQRQPPGHLHRHHSRRPLHRCQSRVPAPDRFHA